MSESIIILMLSVSTLLGALGLIALIWGVKTGQFDDQNRFIDGARYDNVEDYRDAVMMEQKKKERESKKKEQAKKQEEVKKNYMPPD